MAEKKIGEIREELKAVDDEKLPSFIEAYEKDERSGVVKIVEQAKKRFEKLEAEKLRIENLKKYEREYADYGYICGIDEVGRTGSPERIYLICSTVVEHASHLFHMLL